MRPATFVIVAWIAMAVGCGSPTEPDPRIPPPVGTPTSMMLLPCEYVSDLARCPVEARWGSGYSSTLVVTDEAGWWSSASHVVEVSAPGILRSGVPGTADVTVSFNGRSLTTSFRVFAEGPPWMVARNVEYHIHVVDQNGLPLEGVEVAIVAGGNAGMTAMSDRFGRAIFRGDIVCGPITVRGSKSGYRDWSGSATRCGRAGNGAWGSETVGPVRMVALSLETAGAASQSLLLRSVHSLATAPIVALRPAC